MKRTSQFAALAFAAAITACSPDAPVAPPAPVPLKVLTVQPPARSAGYAYDGQIWALFDRPLDPGSVDTTTVFIKKDTQRMACTVSYEPTSRRIVMVPRTALALNTTYTVLLTTRVRARDGTSLGQDYLWQFSTSSIRRLVYLSPAAGEVATPVTMLRWSSADAAPGSLLFEVYAGPDSLAVLARTAPLLARTTSSIHLPRQYWPAGQRTYWAVTTTHQATGERIASQVAGFDVIADGAPTHEITATMIEWGGVQSGRTTQYCNQTYVIAGAGYSNAVRFSLDPGLMGTRVKRARLVMYASGNAYLTNLVSAWYCTPTWFSCAMVYPGPPFPDPNGQLVTATFGGAANEMNFESAGLSAWVEGMLRRSEFSGLMFSLAATAGSSMTLNMSSLSWPRPVLYVTVYD